MARTGGSQSKLTAPLIEAAALHLVARDGSAAVSMRQVAAELGVQVGALYNHVPDKQGLLARLVETALDRADAAWAEIPGAGDPGARLDALVRAHLGFALETPDLAFLPEREVAFLDDTARAAALARMQARREALEAILREGRDAGQFRLPDVSFTATAVLSMIEGIARWAPGSGLAGDRLERMCVNMVRRLVPRGQKGGAQDD